MSKKQILSEHRRPETRPQLTRDVKPAAGQPIDKQIQVDKLLEPLEAARENMDEQKLFELIESIRVVGLINPLAVRPEGDKYRIYAGHRRFLACNALGWRQIPCRVFPADGDIEEAVKTHENAFREDLNAAEEARYYGRLLEAIPDHDVDKLCMKVHMRRDYVEGRLLLLAGDPDVLNALAASHIGYGVAQELNRVMDPITRQVYLNTAIEGGCSARQMKVWRVQANALKDLVDNPTFKPVFDEMPSGVAPTVRLECYLCQAGVDDGPIEIIYVHRHCKRTFIDRPMQAQEQAAQEAMGVAPDGRV